MLMAFVFAACADWLQVESAAYDRGTYVAVPLELAPLTPLLAKAESLAGRPLVSRGEAHLTVVTPPEMKRLKPRARQRLLADLRRQTLALRPVCLGVGKSGDLATYFLVVDAPAIKKLRQRAGLWDHYYPHVTLGFTERDLHEADGVRKDRRSCLAAGQIELRDHEMPHARNPEVAK